MNQLAAGEKLPKIWALKNLYAANKKVVDENPLRGYALCNAIQIGQIRPLR